MAPYDAEILADVYLMMTGGQTSLGLDAKVQVEGAQSDKNTPLTLNKDRSRLAVLAASQAELDAHQALLSVIDKKSDGQCLWLNSRGESTQHWLRSFLLRHLCMGEAVPSGLLLNRL